MANAGQTRLKASIELTNQSVGNDGVSVESDKCASWVKVGASHPKRDIQFSQPQPYFELFPPLQAVFLTVVSSNV